MKIVNRQEFLKLPKNTLFSIYVPCVVSDLAIKSCDPGYMENDYMYTDIIGAIKWDYMDYHDTLLRMEEENYSVESDFDSASRDGFFNNDELYFIYEKEDIENLIRRLKECL